MEMELDERKHEINGAAVRTLSLSTYERLVLAGAVLRHGSGSMGERMRTINLRRDLEHTEKEREALNIRQRPGGGLEWRTVPPTTYEFSEKDFEHLRKCLRLMGAAGELPPEPEFDVLLLKFFALEEMEEIAAEEEKTRKR